LELKMRTYDKLIETISARQGAISLRSSLGNTRLAISSAPCLAQVSR
jgi:hypothetical protein